jgi:hypothetical protein
MQLDVKSFSRDRMAQQEAVLGFQCAEASAGIRLSSCKLDGGMAP